MLENIKHMMYELKGIDAACSIAADSFLQDSTNSFINQISFQLHKEFIKTQLVTQANHG